MTLACFLEKKITPIFSGNKILTDLLCWNSFEQVLFSRFVLASCSVVFLKIGISDFCCGLTYE